ncbi:hypothetical protein [Nocardia pneumoniae]|uniref:hypothetical protein n=1 Tax=Nocardia pneumoniae TaxID=228601 RepID=UPI0002D6D34D|nr:hypothetical protein [Nocardia pneumoniae]
MGNKSGWAALAPKLAPICLAVMPVLAVGMALVGFREGALQLAVIPVGFIGMAVCFGYAFALASISESVWSFILAIFIALPVLIIGPIAVQVALLTTMGRTADCVVLDVRQATPGDLGTVEVAQLRCEDVPTSITAPKLHFTTAGEVRIAESVRYHPGNLVAALPPDERRTRTILTWAWVGAYLLLIGLGALHWPYRNW